ncbi:hypothetical protein [Lacipirellula sp.]|uniref:hypothetical protein n=1 Tax=Lacipirellula sp. TaxID=2691419 RepID=UPI003D14D0E0
MAGAGPEDHVEAAHVETGSIAERAIASNVSLRVWFAIGFAVTFVVLAMFTTTFIPSPRIGAIVQCKLWQYYLHEAERILRNEPQVLGLFNEDPARVFVTAFVHTLLALLGGLLTLGIGWVVRRIRTGRS